MQSAAFTVYFDPKLSLRNGDSWLYRMPTEAETAWWTRYCRQANSTAALVMPYTQVGLTGVVHPGYRTARFHISSMSGIEQPVPGEALRMPSRNSRRQAY